MVKTLDLYDLTHTLAAEYLTQHEYPWQALKGIKDLILELLVLFFPFIPPEVMAVISWGMFAGVIFGVIKLIQKVRG